MTPKTAYFAYLGAKGRMDRDHGVFLGRNISGKSLIDLFSGFFGYDLGPYQKIARIYRHLAKSSDEFQVLLENKDAPNVAVSSNGASNERLYAALSQAGAILFRPKDGQLIGKTSRYAPQHLTLMLPYVMLNLTERQINGNELDAKFYALKDGPSVGLPDVSREAAENRKTLQDLVNSLTSPSAGRTKQKPLRLKRASD